MIGPGSPRSSMPALREVAGIALNLLLELLRLILAAELELLDLALLLSSRLVEELVLRLELELTAQLAVIQLLPVCSIEWHPGAARDIGRTGRRYLVQLGANEGMRNGRKRDEDILPGRSRCVVQADVKIRTLLSALQETAVDAVVRAAVRRRDPANRSEQDQRDKS